MVRNFMHLLRAKWQEFKFVCVGLDSDAGKLPILHLNLSGYSDEELLEAQETYRKVGQLDEDKKVIDLTERQKEMLAKAQLLFNRRIVGCTKDIVAAYKINSAFYEALGHYGLLTLEQTIVYINMTAPDVPVILDYKRGDIDNTNIGYVRAAMLADAVTVHPYLGWQAMKPFLDQTNKGVFVLVKTSNEGAGEFQDLEVVADTEGGHAPMPLYQRVAAHVASPFMWNYNGNCCVVAGATYPQDVAKIREIIGDEMPMLLPGIGAQGGPHEEAVLAAANSCNQGLLVNDSRRAIFASSGSDCWDACRRRVVGLNIVNQAVLDAA
jgi:orotidine-5'-phosphate decarboxylase